MLAETSRIVMGYKRSNTYTHNCIAPVEHTLAQIHFAILLYDYGWSVQRKGGALRTVSQLYVLHWSNYPNSCYLKSCLIMQRYPWIYNDLVSQFSSTVIEVLCSRRALLTFTSARKRCITNLTRARFGYEFYSLNNNNNLFLHYIHPEIDTFVLGNK